MSWTIYGYKQEDADTESYQGKAQYVPDVLERVREAIQVGADHVVVLKDLDS